MAMTTNMLNGLLLSSLPLLQPEPSTYFIAPGGAPAWDVCDCGGQLWARVVSIEPHYGLSSSAQSRGMSSRTCAPAYWRVTLGLGIVRCAATVDDQGNAPTAAQLNEDALQVLGDMDALRCALTRLEGCELIRWDPLGPQGGCVGGEWQATVRTLN